MRVLFRTLLQILHESKHNNLIYCSTTWIKRYMSCAERTCTKTTHTVATDPSARILDGDLNYFWDSVELSKLYSEYFHNYVWDSVELSNLYIEYFHNYVWDSVELSNLYSEYFHILCYYYSCCSLLYLIIIIIIIILIISLFG